MAFAPFSWPKQRDGSRGIRLTNAFVSSIHPKYAMVPGLIPDCGLTEARAVGNPAGTGAMIALQNRSHRREIEDTVRRIEKIETALEPNFQQLFVDATALPHKVDAFSHMAQAVPLPERPVPEEVLAGRMARRRPV